ncbi:hypothetical protein AGMMS49992_16560 [Clostridia bacterium]|nr:hypothetical protein AGMMS49992_16560 [Clostridia bacterium]
MPSNKPRISFILSNDELEIVNRFMEKNGFKSQSQAVRTIISMGMEEYRKVMTKGQYQRFDLSSESAALVDDFEAMTQQGKRIVQQVVDAAVVLFGEPPAPSDAVFSDTKSRDLHSLASEELRKLRGVG